MLHIHLTPQDLVRVRVARLPDPLAETVLSLPVLQDGGPGGVAFAGWRERTRTRLKAAMRPLFELAPAGIGEYIPEVFTHAATPTLADSLDHTWSLPRPQWTADFAAVAHQRPRVPRWIHALHHGDPRWGAAVRHALSAYHAVAVAPYWAQITAMAHTDRARRAEALADLGVEGLFTGLHPGIHWTPPVLHVPCETDVELRLAGRGLLLVPTFFRPGPLAMIDNADPDRPLVLRYPVAHDLPDYARVWAPAAPHHTDAALAALLGTTRARILRAAEAPAGTAELGRRTGTSPATASHHTTVLRTAGLLTSDRDGTGVRHTLTPLGRALLNDTV
ncbi:ArsR/SmtB family transcription factor [Streptomyces termitum]|uniref:ArsR/SmtB family transcription factor n=1 Tax=Streptomyces termitum TaxID=67368 RepID=UPI0033B6021F